MKYHGKSEVNAADFMRLMREKLKSVNLDESYLSRAVNDGFSGGEKKRNEMLQMLVLQPKLCVMDETDSGLDVDALKIILEIIKERKDKYGWLVISHSSKVLKDLDPTVVHIVNNGNIIETGGTELLDKVDKQGFKNG